MILCCDRCCAVIGSLRGTFGIRVCCDRSHAVIGVGGCARYTSQLGIAVNVCCDTLCSLVHDAGVEV